MTASTVWINGVKLGEYRGGFTPFSFELTKHLRKDGDNVLVVQLDSTERADIPPFGYEIDYLTFGGIYREVSLRIVPTTYIDNIFAQPKDVLSGNPSLDVSCFIAGDVASGGRAFNRGRTARRRQRDRQSRPPVGQSRRHRRIFRSRHIARPIQRCRGSRHNADAEGSRAARRFASSSRPTFSFGILQNPRLYTVHVRLLRSGQVDR